MTIPNLEELERIAKAATPGPWRGDRFDGTVKYDVVAGDYPNGAYEIVCRGDNGNNFGFMKAEDEAYVLVAHPTAILALIAEVKRLKALREGPGSPSARLNYLHGELNKRFPEAVDVFSSEPPEPKFLAAIDVLREDAERYRWLRRQPNNTEAPRIDVVQWSEMDESANEGHGLRMEELDAAIDAERNKENPNASK